MTTLQLPPSPTPVWEGVSAPKRALWRFEGILFRHRDAFIVGALVVVAMLLRMWVHRGLWLDEATSVAQAKMGYGRMISYMRQSDVHPPLFQTLLWLDIRAFGTSEFAVRLPSMVFGTALVPVLYGAGRSLFNRRTGLVAAMVATVMPVMIWYSQEARMYPEFMFFAAVAIWAQVVAVRKGTKLAWGMYTAATVALLWTQYFTVLHIAVQQLAFLALMWQGRKDGSGKRLFKQWIRSAILIVIFVAPLVYIPLGQIANYGIRDTTTVASAGAADAGSPIYTALSNLASDLIGYHSTGLMTKINALWPLTMLVALAALGRGRTRVTGLLVALIFLPLAALFVVGLKRNDVFELRYFAGAVPSLALLLARAITLLAKRAQALAVICIATTMLLSVALVDEQFGSGGNNAFDFRGVLTQVEAEHQPGDLMLYEPFYLHPTVHYYAPAYMSYPLVTGLESTTSQHRIVIVDSLAFAEKVQSAQRVTQVVNRLKTDRTLVQHIQRNNVEVWVFK